MDDLTAELPGARTDVHDEVGQANGLLVVLDDDDRVTEVAQTLQRRDESTIVTLVQANGGFVQHVEHAD